MDLEEDDHVLNYASWEENDCTVDTLFLLCGGKENRDLPRVRKMVFLMERTLPKEQ